MREHSKNFRKNWISIFFGGIGAQVLYVLVINYSTIFFTDFLGISAGAAGTIFMLSRAWDAVNDPMCGALIEKFNPRFGKVQSFMFVGGLIASISLVILFTVPNLSLVGRTIWGTVFYNMVGMAFTAVTVAVLLQLPRGSNDPDERVSFSIAYSVSCSIAGILMGIAVGKLVVGFGQTDPAKGYQMTAVVSAVIGMVFILGSVLLFRDQAAEREASRKEKTKVLDMIKAVIHTPSFFAVVAGACIANMGLGIGGGGMIYYLTYYLHKPEWMAVILPVMYIGTLGGNFLAGALSRFGKAKMISVGLLMQAVGFVVRMVIGDSSIFVIGLFYFISLAGCGMMQTLINPCLTDCADYAKYRTGTDCQAMTLTGSTLCSKMANGIGTAVLGFALQIGGYDGTAAVQTEGAIQMIYNIHFWPVIILSIIGAAILLLYKLDDDTMAEARKALAAAEEEEV